MTRDEYIATDYSRDERDATPDTDPEEDRLRAEDEAQQQPRLAHCGHTMHVDRSNPERQHCSVLGCDYEVRVRPFGYAPGWTVHEVVGGQEVTGRYTVIRKAGHVDEELADALARRIK